MSCKMGDGMQLTEDELRKEMLDICCKELLLYLEWVEFLDRVKETREARSEQSSVPEKE